MAKRSDASMTSVHAGRAGSVDLDGLADHQVIQRTQPAAAHLDLHIEEPSAAHLRIVDRAGSEIAAVPLRATESTRIVVPVGGPYAWTVSGGEGTVIRRADGILVGDLWVLAGQSNMQGYAPLPGFEQRSAQVNALGMDRVWRNASDPLHIVSASPDSAHRIDEADRATYLASEATGRIGTGLGLTFAATVVERCGVPVGLIATAHGNTGMAKWSPALAQRGGDSLFGSLLLSVRATGGRVAGVLWYQGETEAIEAGDVTFARNLESLVVGLRSRLGEHLRFLHVQLGRFIDPGPDDLDLRWSAVREAQRQCAVADGMATAIDLPLCDTIHLSAAGLQRLGRRLGLLAAGHCETVTVKGVGVDSEGLQLTVRFDGITGQLQPRGVHLPGFSMRGDGQDLRMVHHAGVVGADSVAVHLIRRPEPGEALCYGFGRDPHCVLADEAGNAVPAFGPWPLNQRWAGDSPKRRFSPPEAAHRR